MYHRPEPILCLPGSTVMHANTTQELEVIGETRVWCAPFVNNDLQGPTARDENVKLAEAEQVQTRFRKPERKCSVTGRINTKRFEPHLSVPSCSESQHNGSLSSPAFTLNLSLLGRVRIDQFRRNAASQSGLGTTSRRNSAIIHWNTCHLGHS